MLPQPCDPDTHSVILHCPMGSPTRGQSRAKFRSPLRSDCRLATGNGPVALTPFGIVNHSCEPNVAFDLTSTDKQKWHARALRDIHPGETMTYFYPSTEWDMEQSFECQCGAPVRPGLGRISYLQLLLMSYGSIQTCLRYISGARYLGFVELSRRGFINPHIWGLIEANREKREEEAKCTAQE